MPESHDPTSTGESRAVRTRQLQRGRRTLRQEDFHFNSADHHLLIFMQYYVGKNGQQLGPLGGEQIKARVAAGEFNTSDLIWSEGMTAWEPISTIFNNPYMPSAVLGASPYLAALQGQRLAGRGERLAAVILNQLFALLTMVPGGILVWLGFNASVNTDNLNGMQIAGIGLSGLLMIGLLIYQLTLYLKTGQTLGKKFMGVKVVTFTDGSLPAFGSIIGLREILPYIIALVPLLGAIFSIVDICFIFREDQRCIHDLMANTKVVVA